jgi:hypothetical protein
MFLVQSLDLLGSYYFFQQRDIEVSIFVGTKRNAEKLLCKKR